VTGPCQFRGSTREEGNLLGVDFGNQTVDGMGRGDRRVGRDWPYLDRTILARGSLWCRKDNEDSSKSIGLQISYQHSSRRVPSSGPNSIRVAIEKRHLKRIVGVNYLDVELPTKSQSQLLLNGQQPVNGLRCDRNPVSIRAEGDCTDGNPG